MVYSCQDNDGAAKFAVMKTIYALAFALLVTFGSVCHAEDAKPDMETAIREHRVIKGMTVDQADESMRNMPSDCLVNKILTTQDRGQTLTYRIFRRNHIIQIITASISGDVVVKIRMLNSEQIR